MNRKQKTILLVNKYLPSEPCSCNICRSYCIRPGWWTVEEASKAIEAGKSSIFWQSSKNR